MQENRIPRASSVRWRRIRSQTAPILSFSLALVATGWLWQYHGAAVQGIGEVDSPRVDIASPTAGLVVSLPNEQRGQWVVYDHVRAGDVIAHLEDNQLEVNKNLVRQEIKQLVEQLRSAKPGDDADEAAREAWAAEESQLLALDGQAATGVPTAPNETLELTPGPLESSEVSVATAGDALAPLRAARIALERRWDELSRRSPVVEIQSPISGTLVAVYCWPGQAVPPGALIATIAADHGRHIVGYIPEDTVQVPKPGTPVALRTRVVGSTPIMSEVEQVGQQIEQIPRHQRATASMPQWGIPVRIKMPAESPLRPGSLVDLSFYETDPG